MIIRLTDHPYSQGPGRYLVAVVECDSPKALANLRLEMPLTEFLSTTLWVRLLYVRLEYILEWRSETDDDLVPPTGDELSELQAMWQGGQNE